MSAPVRYEFDSVFAIDAGVEAGPSPAEVEEAQAREQEAYDKGYATARAELEAEQSAKIAQSLETIITHSHQLSGALEGRLSSMEADAAEMARLFASKLSLRLIENDAAGEIVQLMREVLSDLQDAPHIVVRVHESLSETISQEADKLAQLKGIEGSLIVMGEPDIAPGDARIEWADGGVVRERAQIEDAIGKAVQRFIGEDETNMQTENRE